MKGKDDKSKQRRHERWLCERGSEMDEEVSQICASERAYDRQEQMRIEGLSRVMCQALRCLVKVGAVRKVTRIEGHLLDLKRRRGQEGEKQQQGRVDEGKRKS